MFILNWICEECGSAYEYEGEVDGNEDIIQCEVCGFKFSICLAKI
jgi:DNA-directed RNA polymerase subunit RPC12/RpoP